MLDNLNHLFWISGSYYMRKNIMRKICDSIGKFSVTIFNDGDDGQALVNCITEISLFDDNKLIIIRGFPSFGKTTTTDNKNLVELFQNIPETCFIVIDGIPASERPSLYKTVEKIGKAIDFPLFMPKDKASAWVADRFREINKEIIKEDIDLLMSLVGEEDYKKGLNVDKLYVCIKKICAYLGKTNKVAREDILKSSDRYNRFFIFDFVDAFERRDLKKCVSIIESARKSTSLLTIVSQVLGMLQSRFKMLWFAKESVVRGRSEDDIIRDAQQNILKIEKSGNNNSIVFEVEKNSDGASKPEYTINGLKVAISGFYNHAPAISKYSREDIFKVLHCINECVVKSRNSPSEIELLMLIDSLLFTVIPSSLTKEDLAIMREV